MKATPSEERVVNVKEEEKRKDYEHQGPEKIED
jgi:hypothetical protein